MENWTIFPSIDVFGKFTPVADVNTVYHAPLEDHIATTFRSGTYYMFVTKEPITLYRAYGKPENYHGENYAKSDGRFWMPDVPGKMGHNHNTLRMDNAILDSFNNSLKELATVRIPAGTVLYGHSSNPQNSEINWSQKEQQNHSEPYGRRQNLMGGGPQVFIPEKVLTEIVKFQHTNDPNPIYHAQKQELQNFEQQNKIQLMDKTGMPNTSIFKASLKAPNVGSMPLPKEARLSSFQSRSSCNPSNSHSSGPPTTSASSSVSYTAMSSGDRAQRLTSQQALQSGFCSANGISPSQCRMSAPWPGGVELIEALRIKRSKLDFSLSDLYYYRGEIYARKSYSLKSYKLQLPDLITEDELNCLRHACFKTAKSGLSLSLRLFTDKINVTTEGIDDVPGNQAVHDTLYNSDILLCDLIFGHDQMANTKTVSPVKSFENPYDVEYRLLRTYNAVKGGETDKAQKDVQKFTSISPYPKFTMDNHDELHVKEGILSCREKLIKIALRGIYTDYLGNTYFDDNGSRCYSNHPFLFDFEKNYFSYLNEYPVLRKLHSYMAIVGVLLNILGTNRKALNDTTKYYVIDRQLPTQSDELKNQSKEICQLKETIIERNESRSEKLYRMKQQNAKIF